MDAAYLDSLPLTPADRDDIQRHLSAIRLNNARSIRLRLDNGAHLLRIKRIIGHGGWLDWLIDGAASGYHSTRTAERDMALAEAVGDKLDGYTDEQLAMSTNLTALRVLASDPNGDALAAALAVIGQGIPVKPQQAAQLAAIGAVDTRLLDSVEAGRLTIDDAAKVAHRIHHTNPAPEVVNVVIANGVRNPALVDGLDAMRASRPDAFAAVVASGAIHSVLTDIDVPLAQASSADLVAAMNVEEAESEARRVSYLRNWAAGMPDRVADVVGNRADVLAQLASLLPDDGREYHAYVYPQTEEEPVGEPEPG